MRRLILTLNGTRRSTSRISNFHRIKDELKVDYKLIPDNCRPRTIENRIIRIFE